MASFGAKVGEWLMSVYYGATTAAPLALGVLTGGPGVLSVKSRPDRPQVLEDPELGTHHFAELEDVTLHYVANGSTDAPLMLLLHGYPEFWYSWRHQLREFKDKYRVVAVDLRGYSQSDKPSGVEAYIVDKIIADVEQFIRHLGYRSCIMVAHDWGGAVAYMFATKHKAMVDRLIVLNAVHPAALNKLVATYPEQRKMSWYIQMYQWHILPEVYMRAWDLWQLEQTLRGPASGCKAGAITDEDMEAYKYTFQNYADMNCAINWYRAARRYPSKDPSFRSRITSPTLIVFGTGDLALSTDAAELSRKYCTNSAIKYIPGGSHWIQQEEPERVHTYMREFLDGPVSASKL